MSRPKTRPTLYFAYGSNLAWRQFHHRCPKAQPVTRCTLPDFALVFDGVADIVPSRGGIVEGALYRITPACEAALDRYEGFPLLYVKRYFTVRMTLRDKHTIEEVMYYTMETEARRPPSRHYLATIRTGFDDWKIPHETLDSAADEFYAAAARTA